MTERSNSPYKPIPAATREAILSPDFVKEFYQQVRVVDHSDACWVWLGYLNQFGFGEVKTGRSRLAAHRVAWEIEKGPIPHRQLVKHVCNSRSCVRVSHLVLVDHPRRKHTKDGTSAYASNFKGITASIFEDEPRRLAGGVRVVFGGDAKAMRMELDPLLRGVCQGLQSLADGQARVLDAIQIATPLLQRLDALATELEALRERVDVSRETLATTPAEVPAPPPEPVVYRETTPRPQRSDIVRDVLTRNFAASLDIPPEHVDGWALWEAYRLAQKEAQGGNALTLLRQWIEAFREARDPDAPASAAAGAFLVLATRLSAGLGGQGDRAGGAGFGRAEASSSPTRDSERGSSRVGEPAPHPPDPPPAEPVAPA